jgi:NarL family two-component system response regulator LiaR
MPIKLLLVDDHIVVRQGLRMLLAAHDTIEIVGEADDGVQAVRLAEQLLPDVILMDLLLPRLDGIEATRQIQARTPSCAVLMLTSNVQPQQIQAAIRAGAVGYVLKATRAQELIDAIQRAARGQRVLDPIAADALLSGLAHQDELNELTPREHEVLRLLAQGVSNAQIANALTISEATVRTHIANVLSKLNLRDRAHATIYALKRGLISLDEVA